MGTVEVPVVQTDRAYVRVENTLEGFVREYGAQFPGLVPFRAEWIDYKLVRWCSPPPLSRYLKQFSELEYLYYHLEGFFDKNCCDI